MGRVSIFSLAGDAFLGTTLSLIGLINPALARAGLHHTNAALQLEVPEIYDLADFHLKGIINENDFLDAAAKNGFKPNAANYFLESHKLHITPYDLTNLFRRGIITEDQLKTLLAQNKIVGQDVELLLKATEYFPTPSDLVRFAIREVYSPQIADTYGLFQDIPEVFLQESKKAGLPLDQAKNYWGAHWDLPSPSMGFEMLHRRVISEEDLSTLLKSLDVMPYWRDKITKISYRPLTRVDVRRMYTVGVLDQKAVYEAFLDEGYSPENAKLMTEFTVKYDNPEIESLTRASIIDSYKKDLLTREEVAEYFKLLNYTDKILEFWLENADYDKTVSKITSYADDIAERFQMGDIDLNTARQELLNLEVPTNYVDAVIEKMVKQKAKRNKNPSLEDLRRWISTGLISEEYYVRKMRGLGYKDEDIEVYLAEISNTRDTSEMKYLPVDTYVRYMQKGIISPTRFHTILTSQGVEEVKIAEYLSKAGVI